MILRILRIDLPDFQRFTDASHLDLSDFEDFLD